MMNGEKVTVHVSEKCVLRPRGLRVCACVCVCGGGGGCEWVGGGRRGVRRALPSPARPQRCAVTQPPRTASTRKSTTDTRMRTHQTHTQGCQEGRGGRGA
jgi:hypothetical protein